MPGVASGTRVAHCATWATRRAWRGQRCPLLARSADVSPLRLGRDAGSWAGRGGGSASDWSYLDHRDVAPDVVRNLRKQDVSTAAVVPDLFVRQPDRHMRLPLRFDRGRPLLQRRHRQADRAAMAAADAEGRREGVTHQPSALLPIALRAALNARVRAWGVWGEPHPTAARPPHPAISMTCREPPQTASANRRTTAARANSIAYRQPPQTAATGSWGALRHALNPAPFVAPPAVQDARDAFLGEQRMHRALEIAAPIALAIG